MESPVKIAIVSYTNTIPFVYGINHMKEILCGDLLLATPKECAVLFKQNKVDIALVPLACTLELSDFNIVTDFCISADNLVRSVVLMSDSDLGSITRIYLDSHSRTSVELVKILAEKLWNISPIFETIKSFDEIDTRQSGDAFLLIGDKVFGYEGKFAQTYDLCKEWVSLTGKPFVFAVWIARKGVSEKVQKLLVKALEYGTANIESAVLSGNHKNPDFIIEYLSKNIKFNLSPDKRDGMNLFIKYLSEKSCPASPYQ